MLNKRTILLILVLILSTAWTSFLLGMRYDSYYETKSNDLDMSLFFEAWEMIEEDFIKEKDHKKIIYGAIDGMIKSLDDEHSSFFTPQETIEFLEEGEGFFEGIGIQIGIKDKQLKVVAPLPETPGEKAGLLPGDKILKIDEKSTEEMKLEEAVTRIRGPKDSFVVLTILRDSWEEPKDFKIQRSVIKVPSISLSFIDNIAYLQIYQFNRSLIADFSEAVNEILKKDTKGIILDLRNNPGGYLDVCIDIAKWFLNKNDVILIEQRKIGKERIHSNNRNGQLVNYNIIVLINQGSASASEILAGALRDNGQAIIVGETSFGKGSVQELKRLKDFSSIKITIAKWFTPNREPINEIGIKPDYLIEKTTEDVLSDKDPQLNKALELIKKIN